MDGMSKRNHCHMIIFSLHCFNGFSVASWRIMQHVVTVVTYGVLTVRDRFCGVLQYHGPCYQLWGHCKTLIFENFFVV